MSNLKYEITIACSDNVQAGRIFDEISNTVSHVFNNNISNHINLEIINRDINIKVYKDSFVYPLIAFTGETNEYNPNIGIEITIWADKVFLANYLAVFASLYLGSYYVGKDAYTGNIQIRDNISSISIFIKNNIGIKPIVTFIPG